MDSTGTARPEAQPTGFISHGGGPGERAVRTYAGELFRKRVSSFRFGGAERSAAALA